MGKGKINTSISIFFYTMRMATLQVFTKFEGPGSKKELRNLSHIFSLERKKNGQIKGPISN